MIFSINDIPVRHERYLDKFFGVLPECRFEELEVRADDAMRGKENTLNSSSTVAGGFELVACYPTKSYDKRWRFFGKM